MLNTTLKSGHFASQCTHGSLRVYDVLSSGRASFCTVRVVLTDENDNAPRFRAAEYRLSIKANVATGALVTQIQATDPDAGSNGRITYSLYSEARLSLVDVLEVGSFLLFTHFEDSCFNRAANSLSVPLDASQSKPQRMSVMVGNWSQTLKPRLLPSSFSIRR